MRHSLLSLIRFASGFILLMLGVVGLIIPILHSAVLLIIAFPLLSPTHGVRFAEWLKRKYKSLQK